MHEFKYITRDTDHLSKIFKLFDWPIKIKDVDFYISIGWFEVTNQNNNGKDPFALIGQSLKNH